ncbi:MAG TPA: hypothetical protein VFE24_07545 [Pirellulales bacterium]|nr:hypothetical protein [Pirellulales bacterium]
MEYQTRRPAEALWAYLIGLLDAVIYDEKHDCRVDAMVKVERLSACVAKNMSHFELAMAAVMAKVVDEARKMYSL